MIDKVVVNGRSVQSYVQEIESIIQSQQGKKEPVNVKMFSSFLTPKATSSDHTISGRGIIAVKPINKGEIVAIWGGHLLNTAMLEILPDHIEEYPVQIWYDLFLGPSNENEIEIVDFMNHSCEPSCGVAGSILVVTKRDLAPGEELTFDYGTTDTVGQNMECHCGSPRCRGMITNADWKDEDFRNYNEGFLTDYIAQMAQKMQSTSHTEAN